MKQVDNVFANQIMQESSVISAKMERMVIQLVVTVIVMCLERNLEFVTKSPENVCAKMDTERRAAIAAYQVSTIILNVFLAIAHWLALFQPFVMQQENVHAYKTLPENVVISVWLDFINFPNACLAIATITDQLASRATMKDSVIVKTISMKKRVICAKKTFTIIHFAKVATVILLV